MLQYVWQYVWASPNTLLGLLILALLAPFGARATLVTGVIEVHGRVVGRVLRQLPPRGMAMALTLGHIVLAECIRDLEQTRVHERVHVRQYARWGPFFLPAYAASSLWQAVRGRDPYRDNGFERQAYGDG